jgi:polysaccharide export outer membrane protein
MKIDFAPAERVRVYLTGRPKPASPDRHWICYNDGILVRPERSGTPRINQLLHFCKTEVLRRLICAGLKEKTPFYCALDNSWKFAETEMLSKNMGISFIKIGEATGSQRAFQTAFVGIAVVGISLLLCSCEVPPVNPPPEQMAAPISVSLVAGDVIKLTFSGAPELNQSQKIRADGKINLPLVGEVDAAGKTIGSLQSELALRYKPQLQSTTVVVTLESSVTQVVVSGAVSKPAKLSFDRPTTVFQAIMEAGGVSEFGSLKKVHLIRIANGEQHTQILDLRPTASGQTTRPYYVRDGDVIYIPSSPF